MVEPTLVDVRLDEGAVVVTDDTVRLFVEANAADVADSDLCARDRFAALRAALALDPTYAGVVLMSIMDRLVAEAAEAGGVSPASVRARLRGDITAPLEEGP